MMIFLWYGGGEAADVFSIRLSFNILFMVIIGGLGSLTGAAIASVLVAVLQQFANVYLNGTGDFIVVALLAVVLLVRPTGLMGRKAA